MEINFPRLEEVNILNLVFRDFEEAKKNEAVNELIEKILTEEQTEGTTSDMALGSQLSFSKHPENSAGKINIYLNLIDLRNESWYELELEGLFDFPKPLSDSEFDQQFIGFCMGMMVTKINTIITQLASFNHETLLLNLQIEDILANAVM